MMKRTLPEEMGTLPEVKDVEENSGKNSNPVRNPAKFILSPEIIFSGLKPDRINPGKSGRIRSGSNAKSKIWFPDPEKQFGYCEIYLVFLFLDRFGQMRCHSKELEKLSRTRGGRSWSDN